MVAVPETGASRFHSRAGVTGRGKGGSLTSYMFGRSSPVCLLLALFWIHAFAAEGVHAKVSPLAPPPDWSWLEKCQSVFTRKQFLGVLEDIYAPNSAAAAVVEVGEKSVRIRTEGNTWKEVAFAPALPADGRSRGPERFWRRASEMGPAPADKPLKGVRIVIDPGHLGGEWARMEARFFQIGQTRPVAEGDLTLSVARKLKPLLEKQGAEVHVLRAGDTPVTPDRPDSLRGAAAADLNGTPPAERLRQHSELFFYRISEIRARAQRVNEELKPDMVLCLHFNAEEWGEPDNPQLIPRNHLHALVNGCYGPKELESDDIRAEMLGQLFGRVSEEAVPLSAAVLEALAAETGLPPFVYFSPNAKRIGENPYLYARNLLANRLYKAPVVFLEPYVMNSGPVWRRVQQGDYPGEKMVEGVLRKSLLNEYAAGVAEGVVRYYRAQRR